MPRQISLERNAGNAGKSQPMGRRERSKVEKRARIIGAARALFAQQGFSETTTQQIAAAADIGTGTLFLYVKSKEDLLALVFKDEMQATALESFRKIPLDEPLVEQIMTVLSRMIEYHEKDIELAGILIKEIAIPVTSKRGDDINELVQTILAGFVDLIRSAQGSGSLPSSLNPLLTARTVFAIYYFGLIGWLGGIVPREVFTRDLRAQLELLLDRNA